MEIKSQRRNRSHRPKLVAAGRGNATIDPVMFEGNCGRKVRYANKAAARDQARRSTKKLGELIQHYKCETCHGFHIGHARQRRAS